MTISFSVATNGSPERINLGKFQSTKFLSRDQYQDQQLKYDIKLKSYFISIIKKYIVKNIILAKKKKNLSLFN